MQAQRAEHPSGASRKKLVMTDTTLCADMKEPKKDIKAGELLRNWMVRYCTKKLESFDA